MTQLAGVPKVSVIVPTFNRAAEIAATLESTIAQTWQDWECIVIDDGSTDSTREIVEEFVKGDRRFRYLWQENSSASRARNRGIELARGEFIAFLDSDDLMCPDKLEWQVSLLEAHPEAVLVYGDTFHFRNHNLEDGYLFLERIANKPSGRAFESLLCCSSIYAPMVRTASIRALGGFDTSLPSAEDWDMWLQLARMGEILYRPRLALYYRLHDGNKSGNTYRNYCCAWRVANKHIKSLPLWKRLFVRLKIAKMWRYGYVERLYLEAKALGDRGQLQAAGRVWLALMRLNPLYTLKPPRVFQLGSYLWMRGQQVRTRNLSSQGSDIKL